MISHVLNPRSDTPLFLPVHEVKPVVEVSGKFYIVVVARFDVLLRQVREFVQFLDYILEKFAVCRAL